MWSHFSVNLPWFKADIGINDPYKADNFVWGTVIFKKSDIISICNLGKNILS